MTLQVGQAVNEIQELLPLARIVYCSATGCSEAMHMAYMTRLGLWGPGTLFPAGLQVSTSIFQINYAFINVFAVLHSVVHPGNVIVHTRRGQP